MNIKKMMLAACLLTASAQTQAVGELGSTVVGVAFGPLYEYLLVHTPYGVSLQVIPAVLLLQCIAFAAQRSKLCGSELLLWEKTDRAKNTQYNFLLTYGAALGAAGISYGIDCYLSKKNNEEPITTTVSQNVVVGTL